MTPAMTPTVGAVHRLDREPDHLVVVVLVVVDRRQVGARGRAPWRPRSASAAVRSRDVVEAEEQRGRGRAVPRGSTVASRQRAVALEEHVPPGGRGSAPAADSGLTRSQPRSACAPTISPTATAPGVGRDGRAGKDGGDAHAVTSLR